jgi:hypothetical protein
MGEERRNEKWGMRKALCTKLYHWWVWETLSEAIIIPIVEY